MVAQAYINAEHQQIFEQTKHIPGWQVLGDSDKLYELAYQYGDVILEIGTFGGRSATVELRGALANPERTTPPQFYGIDIDIQGIWRTLTSLAKENLTEHALLYHGNLQDFIASFSICPTMVFVDGDHRYEGVKRDLMSLAGFLKPGTPVLCHDYTNPENDTGELGVRRAIDEFVDQGFATFSGTFGCSAFLIMSDQAEGVAQDTPLQEFYRRKSELLVSYALDMQDRWHNSEGDRKARGDLIRQQQEKLAAQQQLLQQTSQPSAEAAPSDSVPEVPPADEPSNGHHQWSDPLDDAQPKLRQRLTEVQKRLKEVKQREQKARQTIADLQGQIAAMESSKFWKLRSLWFRIKSPFQ